MPHHRTTAAALARHFDASRQPVYVLDDELTLVFLNRAAADWLGAVAGQLVGTRCRYCSPPLVPAAESADAATVAAALCPPPEVLAGQPAMRYVSLPSSSDRAIGRRVQFIPLAAAGVDLLAVVAMAGFEDVAVPTDAPAAPAVDADAVALHELVRRYRWQAAGRCAADRLIGGSTAMRRAQQQVALATESRCSVLLVGPPGSGRQHVAAVIHYAAGAEAAGSLVPLDCTVLGAELIHSTVSALRVANPLGRTTGCSTLLLSHVDEAPPDVQAALASALVDRDFPLRLMATAAQPLDELVHRGRFQADLAATLSTLVIALPPLAARREDIPALAQLFLEEHNAESGKQLGGFAAEALDLLDAYPWPGNLDELFQAVAEAHRRAGGPLVGVDDLPERVHLAAKAAAHPRRPEETIVLDEFLGRVERELIRRALAQAKGNKAKAARLLGLTRPRLYRRMVQLGLE